MVNCEFRHIAAADNRASDSLESLSRTGAVHGETPLLCVRVIGGLAVVDIINAEFLFEERALREIGRQLHGIVKQGHTRLLVNFGEVRSMSSEVIATLAGLYRELHRRHGRLGLYGLQPLFQDMLRICQLDRMFDIFADEADALSRAP